MAIPAERLADSLEELRRLQEDGKVAIQSDDLSRTHRERLIENGFLKEVIRGWYIVSRPDEKPGDTTTWYSNFWHFCSRLLKRIGVYLLNNRYNCMQVTGVCPNN